ncbi:hypothetical protein [Hymenobacter lucidus]|uniref:GNAT family N-acetyltransferase n=1 Tax=Hymenobacter lucidus TaxID=2880930 RepID=A0ABS8AQN6_9BACT|nr:hypothetical protein [Hymenobacter lucidus]MCB2408515.1 hypothetical protein [Hymenobacter lucidus]
MGQQVNSELVAARADKLFFYSPYNFLRYLDVGRQQELFGTGLAQQYTAEPNHQVFEFQSGNDVVQFLYTFLPWDTAFFEAKVYKVFTILFTDQTPASVLEAASIAFRAELAHQQVQYCFVELPVEDTRVAQALGSVGWRLVETRLNFYHDAVDKFEQHRYPVRLANITEAEHIGAISSAARNDYDRFHADSWFGHEKADAFLRRYATAAVQGYCDAVLVPAEPELPVDSFLAITDSPVYAFNSAFRSSRITLTAVGPSNRGWHIKLVAETIQRARTMEANCVLMTTQATNRAVFRTCEKLGFKLGSTNCILAYAF